jgi:hypothetical protein
MRPAKDTYPVYMEHYIPLAKEKNVIDALEYNWKELSSLLSTISSDFGDFAYAENKWTVKQLVNHLSDTERIFAYRALRFARQDPQLLSSFDEDYYAAASDMKHRSLTDVSNELQTVRIATLSLFKSFTTEALLRTGKTAIGEISVLALGYAIAGHARHHMNIMLERYLKNKSANIK